jgi:hypothetical protein
MTGNRPYRMPCPSVRRFKSDGDALEIKSILILSGYLSRFWISMKPDASDR